MTSAADRQLGHHGEPDRLVWYAAYGSNMHAVRLYSYLAGGTPPGGRRTYPGCRDGSPPRRTAPVLLPGGIYFALESVTWTGGMAFYDHAMSGEAAARAYLVTVAQFSDIAAQEMGREPGADLDLGLVVSAGRAVLGDGRYETVVHTGTLDGYPMVTFTAPWRSSDVKVNRPAATYLEMISSGLHEAHGWSISRIADYLAGRPGIRGNWTGAQLAVLAARGIDLGVRAAAPDSDDA